MQSQFTTKDIQQFWSKVDKSGECWVWTGKRFLKGYGYFCCNSRTNRTHRMAWEITNGPIPDGLLVCHHCDNPPCVRPDHLFLGTNSDNMQDAYRKGRPSARFSKDNPSKNAKHFVAGERPNAKLTPDQVREMRRLYEQGGISLTSLAALFRVERGHAGRIIARRYWKDI